MAEQLAASRVPHIKQSAAARTRAKRLPFQGLLNHLGEGFGSPSRFAPPTLGGLSTPSFRWLLFALHKVLRVAKTAATLRGSLTIRSAVLNERNMVHFPASPRGPGQRPGDQHFPSGLANNIPPPPSPLPIGIK